MRHRRPRPGARRDASAGWEALSAAVAVLTARRDGGADLRSAMAADGAVFGLAVVASAALEVLMPEDKGARALEGLGLLALERRTASP